MVAYHTARRWVAHSTLEVHLLQLHILVLLCLLQHEVCILGCRLLAGLLLVSREIAPKTLFFAGCKVHQNYQPRDR